MARTAEQAAVRPFADTRHRALWRVLVGFLAVLAVCTFGVVGYVVQGWSVPDAFFMVAITISTVGYGEVRPLDSISLRVHTMLLLFLGTVTLTFTVAAVLQFITEGEILRILGHQRVKRQIDALSGHMIVAGLGRMGLLTCAELSEAGVPFVVIERTGERLPELEARGWLHVIGDATDEEILREAGLPRARALIVTIPNDAENVFITLTAREIAPNVRILSRAEQPTTQKKLLQAGANHVVLPAAIGAHRLVSILLNPTAVEFTELVTKTTSMAIELEEIPLREHGLLVSKTLRDTDIGRLTGVMVIALKRADGVVQFPPRGDEVLAAGDALVLLGRREHLDHFRTHFCQDV